MTRSGQLTPIGLDLGRAAIKAVQLRRARRGWTLYAATLLPRQHEEGDANTTARDDAIDDATLTRLNRALDRQGFTGRDVVVHAPPAQVMTGIFALPKRDSGAPVEQLARMEMAQTHRLTPDTFEMSMWDLPLPARAGDATHVMAAACPTRSADDLLDRVEDAGLQPLALDIQPCAAARACAGATTNARGITAVLDLGWSGTRLAILLNDVLIYERQLTDSGCGALHDGLKQQLQVDHSAADYMLFEVGVDAESDDEELASRCRQRIASHFEPMVQELRASLNYAEQQYPDAVVDRLLLIGGGASIAGLSNWFGQSLESAAQVVAPRDTAGSDGSANAMADRPALALAVGLALHGQAAA